jgi:uncharacterized protein
MDGMDQHTIALTLLAVMLGLAVAGCSDTTRPAAKNAPDTGGKTHRNRLADETSPYLLQHASNPVDWYPWGAEALVRAKREDKPIFLSVGYSTCHWCHVMERESFERQDVADILNKHFVAIKVDREERPDIDKTYMLATQMMTGRGGWPNSVWLTPDGRPWYAGTYFPREDGPRGIGFKTLLLRLAEVWTERRDEAETQAARMADVIARADAAHASTAPPDAEPFARVLLLLHTSFDARNGGFGGAPKFPPHAALRLLLHEAQPDDAGIREFVTSTLDGMMRGGMRDHIGGGFHRYSTDARWFLPHFEKMLYDNALLARNYVDGWRLTGDERYRRVAIETCDWVLDRMTDAQGGFYSALDADSEGEEGKFYVWARPEVLEVLGAEDGELFCRVYGIVAEGNFHDEATGQQAPANVVFLPQLLVAVAEAEHMETDDLRRKLAEARARLNERRDKRVPPLRDDKVLTSWNGLMIGALAHAGKNLQQPRYIAAAEKAAQFILEHMRTKDGRLLRTWRGGAARLPGYLDDYAFLADGLLDLHAATGKAAYRDEARKLTDLLLKHFADPNSGGFFFTSDEHESLLLRSKSAYDAAIPSGNGVAARVLLRLGGEYRAHAEAALATFAGAMHESPRATLSLILADAMAERRPDAAQDRAGPVAAWCVPKQIDVRPGGKATVAVHLDVQEGWHINAHEPAQDFLIGTEVSLAPDAAASLTKAVYPAAKRIQPPFSDDGMLVYSGRVLIRVELSIAADVRPGDVLIRVQVQACDDRQCSAPAVLELPLTLNVAP